MVEVMYIYYSMGLKLWHATKVALNCPFSANPLKLSH